MRIPHRWLLPVLFCFFFVAQMLYAATVLAQSTPAPPPSPTPLNYVERWELEYSTFLGGSGDDYANAVAVDSSGFAYVAGATNSADFPTVASYQPARAGNMDAFISKFSADGASLIYSTYLGTASANSTASANGIAVDALGRAHIVGNVDRAGFPVVNPYQTYQGGSDVFLTILSADGASLDYSTYLGGSQYEYGGGICLNDGDIYIAGKTSSTNFPTVNPFQAYLNQSGFGYDFFVAKFDSGGTSPAYSTYLGGTSTEGGDRSLAISVDADGHAYVTGATASTDFPTAGDPFQAYHAGPPSSWDVIVTKFSPDGSSLVFSTFLGGAESLEYGTGIAADGLGGCYVTGFTQSADFPTAGNPYQPQNSLWTNAFLARLSPDGSSLVFSTYLGGSYSYTWGESLALDADGLPYVSGTTTSTNFPTLKPWQAANAGGRDQFVTKFTADGSAILFSSYLGGSGDDFNKSVTVDESGNIYLAGITKSSNFPTVNPFQAAYAGGLWDGTLSKLSFLSYHTTPTPTPTPEGYRSPTPTPTSSVTPTPSVMPTPSVTSTPTPSVTPMATATPTASATPSAAPSVTPTPSVPPTPVPLPEGISYCLPAGGTRIGETDFDTYILIFNPGEEAAPVEVRFVAEDGEIALVEKVVASRARLTVRMREHVEEDGSFSTIVTSLDGVPLAVERAMYWTESEGRLAAGPWTGGHAASGTTAALQWHLGEGSTHIFDQFVHVLNPDNLLSADVEATFVDRHGSSWNVERMVPPQSNWTIDVFAEIGSRDQVSTRVRSRNEVPVAVDRTMYWPRGGPWDDGHASAGAPAAALAWRLAEGATHLFDCYLAIYNPSETETAEVLIGFTGAAPGIIFHPAEVGPLSRYTLKVNNVVGVAGAVSATVVSNIPVVAERAMYWPPGSPDGWTGGHGSVGTPQAFSTWQLAEGAAHLFDCYLLIFNPSDTTAAVVEITFLDKNGNSVAHQETVAPLDRESVKVNDLVGSLEAFSATVESDIPVVTERAMYWPKGGPWTGGHSSVGAGE